MDDGMSSELVERPEIPPIPADMRDAWDDACKYIRSPRVKLGLQYYLGGHSWRESARLAGLTAQSTLHDAARNSGLIAKMHRTDRIVASQRAVAYEASQALLARIRDDDVIAETGLRDLGVVAAISVDKVLASEKASGTNQGVFSGVFGDALASLSEHGGGSVSLTLEVHPAEGIGEVIDVGTVNAERTQSNRAQPSSPPDTDTSR